MNSVMQDTVPKKMAVYSSRIIAWERGQSLTVSSHSTRRASILRRSIKAWRKQLGNQQ